MIHDSIWILKSVSEKIPMNQKHLLCFTSSIDFILLSWRKVLSHLSPSTPLWESALYKRNVTQLKHHSQVLQIDIYYN